MSSNSELILTLAGLVVGALTAVYSLMTDKDKPAATRWILVLLAGVGLLTGVAGAYHENAERIDADKKAKEARDELQLIRSKVIDSAALDTQINAKVGDLTTLNKLGPGRYYVVLDTFPESAAGTRDYENVRGRLLRLYPDAEKNDLLWKRPIPGSSSYELIFGRNLTVSAAETFRRLAAAGLSNGNPLIRREE